MKLKHSLLARYLIIISSAIILLPLSFPLLAVLLYNIPFLDLESEKANNQYLSGNEFEKLWHRTAENLSGDRMQTEQAINRLHEKYPDSRMFWVDDNGAVQGKHPAALSIPDHWTPAYTVAFMKKSHGFNADPFTVVAFIGKGEDKGFMVLQVPRKILGPSGETMGERHQYAIIIAALLILGLFMFVSWIFFYKIRKRLLALEKAMETTSDQGIPIPIEVHKMDEIGRLELSFNEMVRQLETSRTREQEEEDLRRQLIANLSHDLRTPLTAIRGHAFSLRKEQLTSAGQESLVLIDQKINFLGELIDNLLSYTLLSAGKYPFHPQETDISRLLRSSMAAWYPVFEGAGFTIEAGIPEQQIYWKVDPQWFTRILDNLFQNINRHAKAGKYLFAGILDEGAFPVLVLEDRGPGMVIPSEEQGAGIGLSIVSLMLKEMQLDWKVDSGEKGTRIAIYQRDKIH